MQITLEELKRKEICPILHYHNWNYRDKDPHFDFFRFCIAEMMRWHSRKGRGISYDIMSSLVSRFGITKNIDREEIGRTQLALKKFTNGGLYSKMSNVLTSVEITVGVPKQNAILFHIPAICSINNQTVFLSWNNSIRTLADMKQLYETRLVSVWSFYSLNKYGVFYNIYWDEEEEKLKHIRYKPNQYYIRDSKKFFMNIGKRIDEQYIYPPPYEVCINCARRAECLTTKTKRQNWQKSW